MRKVTQLAQLPNSLILCSMDQLAGDGLHLAGDEAGHALVLAHPGDGQHGERGPGQGGQVSITQWREKKSVQCQQV